MKAPDLEDHGDVGTFCIGFSDEFDNDRKLVHALWSGQVGRTEAARRARNADCRPAPIR
jgi:hypothetical protein